MTDGLGWHRRRQDPRSSDGAVRDGDHLYAGRWGSFQITGAYDKAFFGVDPVTGSTVVTQQPTVGIQVSQFPVEPQQYDTLMINKTGEQWQVREVHLDGHGGGRLMLNGPGQTDA